jgi:hypothetical protein
MEIVVHGQTGQKIGRDRRIYDIASRCRARDTEPVLLGDDLLGDSDTEVFIAITKADIEPVPGCAGGAGTVLILAARRADGRSHVLVVPKQPEVYEPVHISEVSQI